MKQEEKTEHTKERILAAALEEFGTYGYSAATINAICSKHNIPKGLLYHNFTGKDDLYLACIARCFNDIMSYLQNNSTNIDLKKYLELRFLYLSQYPLRAKIFFEAILHPPLLLSKEISTVKADFDCFNRQIYAELLSNMTLREGVTETEVMEYYELIQQAFHEHFSDTVRLNKNVQSFISDYEGKLAKLLDFMLYGVIERRR